jgi:hypothetical protein
LNAGATIQIDFSSGSSSTTTTTTSQLGNKRTRTGVRKNKANKTRVSALLALGTIDSTKEAFLKNALKAMCQNDVDLDFQDDQVRAQ